jgi:lambda family phage tail tape measure protein
MRSQKTMSIRLAVVDGKKVEDQFQRIGGTGEKAFNRITRSTAPANASLKAVDTTARALNSVFRQAVGLVAAYAGLNGLFNSARSINETGMAFQGVNTALVSITGSSKNAADEMAYLESESERLGLNLLEISKSYMQITAAAKGSNLEGQASRDIFTSIAEAATVLQLSTDQTSGAIRAITQIMSKGKVQAEELRGQLGERLYGAFQLAARGMGITTAELDKMLEQGKVIADDFLPKFAAEIRKTFGDGVPEASKNARAELNRFNNAILEIERSIATGGFIDGMTEGYRTLTDTLNDPAIQNAARDLGETLGSVIATTAEGLAFLVENADLAVTAIGGLIIARTVAGGVTLLNASLAGNAGLVFGLQLANTLSTGFAARLIAVEGATKLASIAMIGFRSALMLVGGPVGVAVLSGVAILKLASGHDVARKAANDHAEELKEIKQQLMETADAADDATEALSETESVYRYTKQLETAKDNIEALQKQLRLGGIGGFWDQFMRAGSDLEGNLYQVRKAFNSGELSATEYSDALFKLATKYPDFGEQAEDIQQQVHALLAAELAAKRAAEALNNIRQPQADSNSLEQSSPAEKQAVPALSDSERSKIQKRISELHIEEGALQRLNRARSQGGDALKKAMIANEQDQTLRKLGLDLTNAQTEEHEAYASEVRGLVADIYNLQTSETSYRKSQNESIKAEEKRRELVADIRMQYHELTDAMGAAISKADTWKTEALSSLDQTKAGYDEFASQVETIYQDMIAKARDEDLQNSKVWEDGLKRGFRSVFDEASDAASGAENLVTNAFSSMEDALVDFVKTGKLDFASLADSIISDMIRMQIQSSVTKPLSNALGDFVGSLFGGTETATAHTGGVIGGDHLSSKKVSPSAFIGAPRFHTGGIVGDEVPIIAKKGEAVFTPGQMKLLGGSLGSSDKVNVRVNVHNHASNATARADVQRDGSDGLDLNIIIEEIENTMTRNVSRGEGMAPTLERRYGLNPAAGSYR